MRNRLGGLLSAGLVLVAGGAAAADLNEAPIATVPVAVEVRDIIIDVGLGAQLEPLFPSSQRYTATPWPIVELQYLRLPFFGEVVSPTKPSFYVYPSFDFVNERSDADASYLRGIDDVDAAYEIGMGAAFEYRFVKAFAEVRYGVSGHDGFVADLGLDAQYESNAFEISAGPRVSFATENYMDTYFSVPLEARRLRPYDADGGIKDAGIEMTAAYALTDAIRIQAKAEWIHYLGDAEDSPIVERGNDDEFMVGLGLTYRFGADLY